MKVSLSLCVVLVCTVNATAQFAKPTEKDQIDLGKRAATELRKAEKVLPESDKRVKLVRRIGQALLSTIKTKSDWEFSFDVIQSKQVNAFALPGGPTFIYTGLLDKLKTEDELAGIMGHELIHVQKEHWAYAYRDSQQRSGILLLGALILRPSQNVFNLANLATDLAFELPFSRRHETEADEGGFTMMVAAGFNPKGLADVFTMLRALSKGGNGPGWMSDHPDDKKRIDHIQDLIVKSGKTFPPARPIDD